MELVNSILEWPIIVQGALGSCLFWLLLTIGQRIFSFTSERLSSSLRVGHSFARMARENFYKQNFEASTYAFFVAIYAGIHYFLKFVLVVFIGYLVEQFVPVFGYVGYLIGFYFLFRALSYLPHFSTFQKEDNLKEKTKRAA